jgi:hypothetical protein
MAPNSDIIVVSGLPRSGTSLMMQMLHNGGIPVLTDERRSADADNPRGYYEFERAKSIKRDSSWIAAARGKVIKMVSVLLYDLPQSERYRVIFMQRALDEVLVSQEKMLQRLDQPTAPIEKMRSAFTVHLERLFKWLPLQSHIQLIQVSYNDLMSNAEQEVARIRTFLDADCDATRMLNAIDPDLYRNRNM